MIGGNLQSSGSVGQEMAQIFQAPESLLADHGTCCSLDFVVVALSLRAKTGSLFRYPSPDGRCAFPLGAPPIFLAYSSISSCDRRSLAHFRHNAAVTLSGWRGVSFLAAGTEFKLEGYSICRSPNGSLALCAPLHLQHAATQPLNRASSARVQAQARPLFWTATRSAVRSSAARQTCFTARAIPAAAKASARSGHSLRAINRYDINHRPPIGTGGFFLSANLSSAGQHVRSQAPEGT